MRRLILAATAATALAGSAVLLMPPAAALPGSPQGVGVTADQLNPIEQVQFRYRGHRHCWYARGWNGPGWYWCGYSGRRGHGWGGPEGWNNWRH